MWISRLISPLWLVPALALGTHAAIEADTSVKSIALRTHSLQQPYLDSDLANRWFDFGGDTLVRTDQYVRLASDVPSQLGWVFSRVPLTATNWEIEVEFSITGKGNLNGDGFAMWLTKERAQPGPVFGHADRFEGLGIFFDTYKNNRPGVVFPYVMAMVGDGQTSYDSDNDGKANEFAGCSARGLRNAGMSTKAKLTYWQDQFLSLELLYKSGDVWTDCFNVNFATEGKTFKMSSPAYLGFSAHTGELSDNFDIINVETKNLYNPVGSNTGTNKAGTRAGGRGRSTKSSGGWAWFFFKTILFVIVAAGAYFGHNAYRTNKRYSRF